MNNKISQQGKVASHRYLFRYMPLKPHYDFNPKINLG